MTGSSSAYSPATGERPATSAKPIADGMANAATVTPAIVSFVSVCVS